MPKNAHPPRSKPAKKAPPPEEDTSFIVFGDGKPKKKKSESSGAQGDDKVKGKGKGHAGEVEDGPKKPDTRTLIGGASWTGKLPVNLFSEYLQKQQWSKPDYRIRKDGDKHFAYAVVLSKKNPKTQEVTTLPPIKIPAELEEPAHQPTAVEARNFAAAYALFRVASAKNMHMMLPPVYKDLWKGTFQELKKKDEKEGKGWMYEADPFFGFAEREKAKAAAVKEREKKQQQREDAQKAHNLKPGMSMPNAEGSWVGPAKNLMRGWERVPKIELGKRTRQQVERLIRRDALWNPHGIQMDANTRIRLEDEIADLGFRRSHVEEAADICKDREEILEWLLIHVPEDDLPTWSLPEGYVAGVSMASSNLRREGAVKRLAAAGYSSELCEEAYDSQGGDERKAAALLQARLLRPDDDEKDIAQELADLAIAAEPEEALEDDPWETEMSSLEAIYDKLFTRPSPNVCRVELDIKQQGKRLILQARKPFGPYPAVTPIITFEAAIPAYIRLSIIRKALLHAEESFVGIPMIYDIIDWVQQNAGEIFKNPGRLADVSSGLAAADHSVESPAHSKKRKDRGRRAINWTPATQASQQVLAEWQAKQETLAQQKMMSARQSLPAWKLRDEIVRTVNRCNVTIISGETGSGKSTQSVQFVLDDLIQRQLGAVANIVCTQPRRISALGLADRVADERCARVGDEIGYTIRGESKQKPGVTKITFVTTGVLLRRLQTSGGAAEDVVAALADISHVIVDEVHERSLDTDFLLVLLRQILRTRKDLKVILMSATLDADVFEAYFKEVGPVGRVEIAGRTHPVTDYYVDDVMHFTGFRGYAGEDDEAQDKSFSANLRSIGFGINYDLIAETVRHIDRQLGDKDGGILIFLPGTMEIDRTLRALENFSNLHALPLHASLLPAEQKRVFPLPPPGKRKVIAATNVAETSITIEDIVAVIDTGRVKETSYDPQNNMVRLAETWASRAACKQRRGRAGRVRAGDCYKLYTRNAEAKMLERPDPEIRRVPLEQMCLSIKAMGVKDVSSFLASALTPPESTAVEGAVNLLSQMGAITDNELTALGRHMSMIPADLRLSKLLVYGATFGCLEAALTIASVLTARSPFISPRERDQDTRNAFDRLRASFSANQGDLLVDLRAYEQWSAFRNKGVSTRDLKFWCQDNKLNLQTMFDIQSNRSQYLSSLREISFIPYNYSSNAPATHGEYNAQNTNDALLRALIAGSFAPQIARIQLPDKKFAAGIAGAVELDPEAREIKYFNQDNGRVFVHPSSTLFSSQTFPSNASFVAYFTKMATSKVFVRDITPFNAYSLLMFAGRIQVDTLGRGLVVDEWIRLRGWARIGVLVSRLRGMLDQVLEKMVKEPGKAMAQRERDVVNVVQRLVERDGLDA